MDMRWELEEAEAALNENPPCVSLAKRYLSKALEQVRCMYCHGPLKNVDDDKPYHAYFKGYRHDECAEKYDGRGDYVRQHGET